MKMIEYKERLERRINKMKKRRKKVRDFMEG